jgi:hypothetical protein
LQRVLLWMSLKFMSSCKVDDAWYSFGSGPAHSKARQRLTQIHLPTKVAKSQKAVTLRTS